MGVSNAPLTFSFSIILVVFLANRISFAIGLGEQFFMDNSTFPQTEEKTKTNFLTQLKTKWGLSSLWQVVLVLAVFSLTGFSIVALRKWIFHIFGFTQNTEMWIKVIVYTILIFPTYQILLLIYGWLLGQFSFFWEKEKKMARAVAGLFKARK